jgi:putative colanic acid biosynthesis glycosyltransferase
MPNQNGRISIITVVLNDKENIKRTLLSVINQNYLNKELIVIDGGSKDGTLEIINELSDKIDRFISEPDRGIYDAMNKGIQISRGEWAIFMNSGDVFIDKNSLKRVFNWGPQDCDVIVCGTAFDYGSFIKNKSPGDLNELWKGMTFCHQSVLVKRSHLTQYPFDIDLTITADYDLFLRLLTLNNVKFKKMDTFLSLVSIGGVSDRNRVDSLRSWKEVASRYYPGFRVKNYFFWLVLFTKLKLAVKKLVPTIVAHTLIKYLK